MAGACVGLWMVAVVAGVANVSVSANTFLTMISVACGSLELLNPSWKKIVLPFRAVSGAGDVCGSVNPWSLFYNQFQVAI